MKKSKIEYPLLLRKATKIENIQLTMVTQIKKLVLVRNTYKFIYTVFGYSFESINTHFAQFITLSIVQPTQH